MACPFPIRVLSDLHLGHQAGLIREIEQLNPLLEGAGCFVFNGDTAELRYRAVRATALRLLDELRETCRVRNIQPVFLNGNHDPEISGQDHASLMDGAVLVFHGHGLFSSITPWGPHARELKRLFAEELARPAETPCQMTHRLRSARAACLRLRLENSAPGGRSATGWLLHALSEIAQPWRICPLIRCWMQTPGLAAEFCARHRPNSRLLAIGHTHWPGCWRARDLTVVNTGSFLPGPGRLMLEIDGREARLKRILQRGRHFHPGRIIRTIPLEGSGTGGIGHEAPT